MKFTAAQFTPTEHSTSEDKAKFANQFVKFVTNGFKEKDFPKWFYNRLSMCRQHIAHYNQGGFYDVWFSSEFKQDDFMRHWALQDVYGDPKYTYSDVERVLQTWCQNINEPLFA